MSDIDTSVVGSVGRVVICREGSANALGAATATDLASAIRSLQDDVGVIILESAGPIFSAGGDISHLLELNVARDVDAARAEIRDYFQELILSIRCCPCPLIARVQGAAVGAGADLALACDIRVASEDAWIQEAWINIGLLSALGAAHSLPQSIGWGNACDLLLTGRRVDANECLRLGLFQYVVESTALDDCVTEIAERIVSHTWASLRATKRVMWESQRTEFEKYLDIASEEQARLICSEEFSEQLEQLSQRLASKQLNPEASPRKRKV